MRSNEFPWAPRLEVELLFSDEPCNRPYLEDVTWRNAGTMHFPVITYFPIPSACDVWGEARMCNSCAKDWDWMRARTLSPKRTRGTFENSWTPLDMKFYLWPAEVSVDGVDGVLSDLWQAQKLRIYWVWLDTKIACQSKLDSMNLTTQCFV